MSEPAGATVAPPPQAVIAKQAIAAKQLFNRLMTSFTIIPNRYVKRIGSQNSRTKSIVKKHRVDDQWKTETTVYR
jgi:hypothetical protein